MRVNCNPQDDNKSGSIFNVIAEKWRDEEFGSILAVFIAHRKVHEKKTPKQTTDSHTRRKHRRHK